MGLRPARTCREIKGKAWTRFSRKKPRKSFVKAMPHLSLLVYHMGDIKGKFDTQIDLVPEQNVQLRDNTLESARQAANKYLEKMMPMQYYLQVRVFPHNVVRENKMIAGAGADRLQKGMRQSFGRATDRSARVIAGQPVFTIKFNSVKKPVVEEAFRRAKLKMSGLYKMVVKPLTASKSSA